MKYKEKLELIYNTYGFKAQLLKLAEESSELIQAILKDNQDNYIEEMADVLVVIEQFLNHYPNISAEINKIKENKTDRQVERINNYKEIN